MKKDFINNEIEILIAGYFTGSVTNEDLIRIQEWISENDDNRKYFNELKDAWILSGGKVCRPLMDIPEIFLAGSTDSELGTKVKSHLKTDLKKYLKLAASWLLIFGLGSALTWLLFSEKPVEQEIMYGSKFVEVSTPLGAKSTIMMPDGSQIWLNAGTTIKYSHNYGQQTRTLYLSGEAYFSVARDSLHPFIVSTPGMIVEALGTRFNVKAYNNEKTISATLEEGSIQVRISGKKNNENLLLKPKDKLIFHKETNEAEKYVESTEDKFIPVKNKTSGTRDIKVLSGVRTELYTSWKDARWVIDGENLSTLAPMLERRFNLKIVFMDEQLRRYKFTGTIENETIDQILKALKLTAPVDYKINKDTLRLLLNIRSREEFKKVMTPNN